MENWFRKKPKENLERQTQEVNTTIETPISQKSQGDDVYSLSIEEIKSQYPERYEVYLSLLRAERNGQEIDQGELSSMKEWMVALNNLDDYIENHKSVEDERVLRDRQFTVFEDIRSSLEQGKKEGYVKLPTGVGKTVLFSQVIESMNVKTLVVVPSKILVSQTGEKLEEFTDLDYGKYYSEIKDTSKNTTIITYPSLIKSIEEGKLNPDDYGLLILDEAHKSLGEKTQQFIKKFNAVKIGFTATPEYSKDRHVDELLEHEIHSMTILEAVKSNLISRFKSIFAFTETDLSEVEIKNGNFDDEELEKAINVPARNLSAVKLYKEMFDGELAVAYCGGVSHANDLMKVFIENGISAEVISGKTSKTERQKILERFNRGETKVLCNARILIEGFNEPKASVALNLHPTLSKVDAEQRSGRVLRNDPDNPDKWATVVDFIDKNSEKPAINFPEIAEASEASSERIIDRDYVSKDKVPIDVESEIGTKKAPPVIEGLRVVVDTKEILQISSEQEYLRDSSKYEIAPEGWMTPRQISNEVDILSGDGKMKSLAEIYRENHPEWFKKYLAGPKFVEHYHPELVKILKELRAQKESAPQGWMNPTQIASLPGVLGANTKIKGLAETYRAQHPEWFGDFTGLSGKLSEHYHPELVKILIEQSSKKEPAPDGWMTPNQISKLDSVQGGYIKIKQLAEKYRQDHPEWFSNFFAGGSNHEHLHPELVKILIEQSSKKEPAPDGWMVISQIAKIEGVRAAEKTLKGSAEIYRSQHPEWFGNFAGLGGKLSEHYHPELVKILRELYSRKEAPEGWMTADRISDLPNVRGSTKKIKDLAGSYRVQHPEWFNVYISGNRANEYYHPDLVKILIDGNPKYDEAPEGWMGIQQLSNSVASSTSIIRKFIEPYRTSNPEWFKKYTTSQKLVTEHYSPEIVSLVSKEFTTEEAPEGWMAVTQLSKNVGPAVSTIYKFIEPYRTSNPEWFKIYRTISKRTEHYSPELVKIISDHFKKE